MPESAARQHQREERERATRERLAIPAATEAMSDGELAEIELDLGSIYGFGSVGLEMLCRVVAEAKRARGELADLRAQLGETETWWTIGRRSVDALDPTVTYVDYSRRMGEADARFWVEHERRQGEDVVLARCLVGQWQDVEEGGHDG